MKFWIHFRIFKSNQHDANIYFKWQLTQCLRFKGKHCPYLDQNNFSRPIPVCFVKVWRSQLNPTWEINKINAHVFRYHHRQHWINAKNQSLFYKYFWQNFLIFFSCHEWSCLHPLELLFHLFSLLKPGIEVNFWKNKNYHVKLHPNHHH